MLLELDREGGWTADEPCFLLFSPYCGNHKKTVFCLIFLIFTYSRVPLSETKMTKIQSQSKQIQTAWHHVDIGSVSACVRRLAKRAELPLESGEWWEGAADDGMMAAERWHFWPGHIWPLAMLCCSGHGTCCGSWAKNWANFLGLLPLTPSKHANIFNNCMNLNNYGGICLWFRFGWFDNILLLYILDQRTQTWRAISGGKIWCLLVIIYSTYLLPARCGLW
jgi:hypothetical protein